MWQCIIVWEIVHGSQLKLLFRIRWNHLSNYHFWDWDKCHKEEVLFYLVELNKRKLTKYLETWPWTEPRFLVWLSAALAITLECFLCLCEAVLFIYGPFCKIYLIEQKLSILKTRMLISIISRDICEVKWFFSIFSSLNEVGIRF